MKSLPSRNALKCATCGRDWSKFWYERELDEQPSDAMIVWRVQDAQPLDKVLSVELVCQGECDHHHAPSMNLSAYVGVAKAWDGIEDLLPGYQWPASLRRKVLAILRDASRLDPEPKGRRKRSAA